MTKVTKEPCSPVSVTLGYLQACQAIRDAGSRVAYHTDPAWLIQLAINRRAGWPDDPTPTRGSAMPVNGRYPPRAAGAEYRALEHFARRINTPRLIVREHECPSRYRRRLRHRFFTDE